MSDVPPPPSSAPTPPPAPVPPQGSPFSPPAPGVPLPPPAYAVGAPGFQVPMVGFAEAVTLAFRQYAVGKGRATRAEYWWFQLLGALLGVFISVASVPAALAGESSSRVGVGLGLLSAIGMLVAFLAALALIIPSIAVTVRRLHDSGKSAHYLWFYLIPLAGPVIMLVFLLQGSEPMPNKYGYPRGWQG